MRKRQAAAVRLEPLESRALQVGFYDGPSPTPVEFNLSGTVAAAAAVRPATAGHAETITIATTGRIVPLGPTRITGTLRIVGDIAKGSLLLDSRLSTLPLRLAGPAPAPSLASGSPSPTVLSFVFHGQGAVPGTLFSSQQELGSGTITPGLGPASGRVPLSLVFRPSSNGPAEEQL